MGNACLRLTFALILTLAFAGCGGDNSPVNPGNGNGNGNGEEITYTSDIQPILAANCTRCHSTTLTGAARNGAPVDVNWNTYAAAVQAAPRGLLRMQAGTMPPTGNRVPAADITKFQQWIQAGTPQ